MGVSTVKLNGTILMTVNDTTATASDVIQKYFYTADGTRTMGTASGGNIPEVTISSSGEVSQELDADTVYHFTSESLTSLTITFGGNSSDQYHFDFISPATPTTLTLPQSVNMPNNFSVEVNTKYEIDICDGYGVFAEWSYS